MTQQQLNNIARKLGSYLLDSGIKMIRSSFNIVPKEYSFGQITTFVQNVLPGMSTPQFDYKYYTTSWDTWQLLADLILIDRTIYVAEILDCDNFAYLYASLASLLIGINSCGVAYGTVYNAKTGKKISGHYFNVIVTDNGKCYCYEPMSDGYCLIEKGKPIVINTWKYQINQITFF